MFTLFVICMVAIAGALLFAWKRIQRQSDETSDYESRGVLLTPTERSFLGVLEQALDSRYRVFSKVRLGDLIKPSKGLDAGRRTTLQNKINQNHVDFVICTANELALVGLVKLDDPSHGHEDRAGRDEFIDQALATTGISILRFSAQNEYSVQDVRTRLSEMMLTDSVSRAVSTARLAVTPINQVLDTILDSNPVPADSQIPACPKCSATMVKRQAIRGRNSGNYFWACSTFPMCRHVLWIGE